jgi:peroxiredoxin
MATLKNRHDARTWQLKYNAAAPKVGEPAPDFELCDSDGKKPVRLSSFQGERPVALIFGSFT